jgi:hypothetical protein
MRRDDEHRWALVSDDDPDEHEVCLDCGAQRNRHGLIDERAKITGGWRLEPGDCIGGHPDPAMRRAERAVVRGLAAEYGKGQQVQMTLPDRIEIGCGGVVVTIRLDVS